MTRPLEKINRAPRSAVTNPVAPFRRWTRDGIARATLLDFGTERLSALCEAAGVQAESRALVQLFQRSLRPWGGLRIGYWPPRYRSNVADDEAPYEFCLALDEASVELQFYVEVLGKSPSLQSNMEAGRRLLETVANEVGAPLDRLRAVEDLFLPESPAAPFTIWLGASWSPGSAPRLKVYLNPQVRGRECAGDVVARAAQRLGHEQAWAAHCDTLSRTASVSGRRDELGVVSLDLSNGGDARFKIYVRHQRATLEDLVAIASAGDHFSQAEVERFYGTLAATRGPFSRKAPLTEAVLTAASAQRPSAMTLEFPLSSYVENDEQARGRVEACLSAFDIPSAAYTRSVQAFTTRPLGKRSGIHAHVTLSRRAGRARVATYLASEAYVPQPSSKE